VEGLNPAKGIGEAIRGVLKTWDNQPKNTAASCGTLGFTQDDKKLWCKVFVSAGITLAVNAAVTATTGPGGVAYQMTPAAWTLTGAIATAGSTYICNSIISDPATPATAPGTTPATTPGTTPATTPGTGDGGTQSGGTPSGGTPSGGTPSGGTPSGGTPSGGTPSGGTPSGGTPSGETPSGGTPSAGTPSGGTPSGGTPSDSGSSGSGGASGSDGSSGAEGASGASFGSEKGGDAIGYITPDEGSGWGGTVNSDIPGVALLIMLGYGFKDGRVIVPQSDNVTPARVEGITSSVAYIHANVKRPTDTPQLMDSGAFLTPTQLDVVIRRLGGNVTPVYPGSSGRLP
jgi:hypothetical protein